MTAPKPQWRLRHWPPLTKTREAELIAAIAKHLDWSQRMAVASRCQEFRQDFRTHFTFEYDPDADPTAKRDALVKIGKLGREFAKAVTSDALQDWDWLPGKAKFTVKGQTYRMTRDHGVVAV